jgi:predicted RNA-binding Zn-ribbon protein involved in translation (DUF1610 family)
MTEHLLTKTLFGETLKVICPNCGAVIEMHKSTANIFIENNVTYKCEDCDEPINLNE